MIWAGLPLDAPRVMGIINLTPDSFSDGGHLADTNAVLHTAGQMLAAGADILDMGAESTRPGAVPVDADTEWTRLEGPLRAVLDAHPRAVISVDTRNPETFARAHALGAVIWNDVSALSHHAESARTAAQLGCPVILMHHGDHFGGDPAPNVMDWLHDRAEAAIAAGVPPHTICLDPGIGFGKDTAASVAAFATIPPLAASGHPVLVGASRKRFIAGLDPDATTPHDRLGGSIAAHLRAIDLGARIIRTHDVREMVQAIRVWGALL